MSGEYGEKNGRPHFHACLFGWEPHDKIYHQKTKSGETIYTSETLTKLWGKGYASVGTVTFASAAYIARYLMTKVTGEKAKAHYTTLDPATGELYERKPEYNEMSLKPGIGERWFRKYKRDVYPHGYAIIDGNKSQTPRYYDKLFEKYHPHEHRKLQERRQQEARKKFSETSNDRLTAQRIVKDAQLNQLKRKL